MRIVTLFIVALLAAQEQTDRQLLERLKALIDAQLAVAPVVAVPPGVSLQAAIDTAADGSTLLLAPGIDYQGSVVITRPVTISTLGWTSKGTEHAGRVTPADRPRLGRIIPTPGAVAGIEIRPGTSGVTVFGVAVAPCEPAGACDLIRIGSGSLTDPAQLPGPVTIRQVLLQGSQQYGGWRGIAANGRDLLIEQCWVEDIWNGTRDTQAIGAWRGGQSVTVRYNYLQSGGENLMVGGSPIPDPAFIPSDWTIKSNILHKPRRWRADEIDRDAKNLLEFKHIVGATVTENLLVGSFPPAQSGLAVLFNATTNGSCPACAGVVDVVFEDNVVLEATGGFSFQGFPWQTGSNSVGKLERVTVRNNYVALDGTGRLLQMANVSGRHDVRVERNTFINHGTTWFVGDFGWAWTFDGVTYTRVPGGPVQGVWMLDNIFAGGSTYGIDAPAGTRQGAGFGTFVSEDRQIAGNLFGSATATQIANYNGYVGSGLMNASVPRADLLAALPIDTCGTWSAEVGADCSLLAPVFALRQYLPEP